MADSYKWKGKFVKKKVYNAMRQRSINGKNRKKVPVEMPVENYNAEDAFLKGNRIVDMNYMASQMYCLSCKKPLLLQDIEKETSNGIASIFKFRCHECLLLNTVESGKKYQNPSSGKEVFEMNTKAALGTLHAGIGQTHLTKLFSTLDLPSMNSKTYKDHERIIGPIVETIAKESCFEAATLERVLTLANLEELKKLL